MQLNRYINLCYAAAAIIFAVLFTKTTSAIMGLLEVTDTPLLGAELRLSGVIGAVVGIGLTLYLWRDERVRTWAQEVAVELSKVTWPGWEETKYNTLVVIVFALITSGILATFDFFWKWFTDLILL